MATSTQSLPSGKRTATPQQLREKAGLAKPKPAPKVAKPAGTTKAVPIPTSGAQWEDSRSNRIAGMLVGQMESFTQALDDERKMRAVGLDEMLKQARVTMNGTIGKAVQRAAKITGGEYNVSITVHLLQQPYRLAMTCVVTRVQ